MSAPESFADSLLQAIEELVETERGAIVRLDAATVESCATEKLRLFEALREALPTNRSGRSLRSPGRSTECATSEASWHAVNQHADRMRSVVAALTRNCLLLTHARDMTKGLLGHDAKTKRAVLVSVSG